MAEKSTFEKYEEAEDKEKFEYEFFKDSLIKSTEKLKELDDDSVKDLSEEISDWLKSLESNEEFSKSIFSNAINNSESWNETLLSIFELTKISKDEEEIISSFMNSLKNLRKYGEDKKSYLNEYDFLMALYKRLKEIYTDIIDKKDSNAYKIIFKFIESTEETIFSSANIYSNIKSNLSKADEISKKYDESGPNSFLNLDSEGNYKETAAPTSTPEAFSNNMMRKMLALMPDLFQNDFTFGFYVESANKKISEIDMSYYDNRVTQEDREKLGYSYLNNNLDGFFVRVTSFDIPLPKARTTQLNFFTRKIEKIISGIEQAHTLNVKFEADQNGYLINFFERTAGWENIYFKESASIDINDLNGLLNPGGYDKRNQKLNIVIKYNDILNSGQFTGVDSSFNSYRISGNETKNIGNSKGYSGFVLEDVQFLGFTNSIDFDRNSANNIIMDAKFRFKQLYKLV